MAKTNNTNKALQASKKNPTNIDKLSNKSTTFQFHEVNEIKVNEFAETFVNAVNEYEALTNENLFIIAAHTVAPEYYDLFHECYKFMPLVVHVNFGNGLNLPSVLNTDERVFVNGTECMIINVYVNEFEDIEKFALRFTKLIAGYIDYVTFLKNNPNGTYKKFTKDYLNYKRACEIFTRMQGFKIVSNPKHGATISFDNDVNVDWVEETFKTENTLRYFQAKKDVKKVQRFKLSWVCDCEKCKNSLPKLTSITIRESDKKRAIPKASDYPTLQCAHGSTIKVEVEETKEAE